MPADWISISYVGSFLDEDKDVRTVEVLLWRVLGGGDRILLVKGGKCVYVPLPSRQLPLAFEGFNHSSAHRGGKLDKQVRFEAMGRGWVEASEDLCPNISHGTMILPPRRGNRSLRSNVGGGILWL